MAAGVDVRVVDKADGPATTSRALGLQPRGVEVLQRAGALGDLGTRSVALREVSVHVGGRSTVRLALGGTTKLVTRPGLVVSQAEIEVNLRRRFAQLGGTIEWGQELLGVSQDSNGMTVSLAGTSARCGWLVGCDGAHSTVRKAVGIAFPGVQVIERFLLADVHADLPIPRDGASVWLHREEMLAAFPLPGDNLWRLMAPAPVGGNGEAGSDVANVLARLLHERTGLPASAVGSATWSSTFRIHRRLAERFRDRRVLLAGDAAHVHSPVGGQGLNTGVGDADNLAWKLALVVRDRARDLLLDSYEAERRPIAEEVLQSTTAMTRMVVGESALARGIRDYVFVPTLNSSVVQRRVWEHASQLKVSYGRGPLGRSSLSAFTRRPRAGDRVADVQCMRWDGTATTLHAELGSKWVVLTPPGSPDASADACVSTAREILGSDLVAVLAGREATTRELLLVRPDAHLAWRGSADPAALRRWLCSALMRGQVPRGNGLHGLAAAVMARPKP